jgi:hypothetical protein
LAQDEKDPKHECVYRGQHKESSLEPIDSAPAAIATELARSVALSVLDGERGSMRSLPHFTQRMALRDFDVFDFQYAICNGDCVESEYCSDYRSHRFLFRCLIDGVMFDAVFALSARHDLIGAPLLYLITGCWKTESGKRSSRY